VTKQEQKSNEMLVAILVVVIVILAVSFGNYSDEQAKERAREEQRQAAVEKAGQEYIFEVMSDCRYCHNSSKGV
jgi:type II secretory pathway pseudopilin PulG